MPDDVVSRELAHHEELYSGFAQQHFAKPAVRALREHMVRRILRVTGANRESKVLSLGCGIGDTELLLAQHVASITGIDLSPSAIRQAREDSQRLGIANAAFYEATADQAQFEEGAFDAIVAVFFLHHVPDDELPGVAQRVRRWLKPGGVFWGLDPNRYRLSGAIGSIVVPHLMKRYQTEDERELVPAEAAAYFAGQGLEARAGIYDFVSTPLAGLFPSWRAGYHLSRIADELLIRTPVLRFFGSNFELIVKRPCDKTFGRT